MSVGGEPGHLHPTPTERSGYRYFFYDKHHGRGGPDVARWLPELTDDDEFAIFNQADLMDFSDGHGNLYGMRFGAAPNRRVLKLGTLRQQVAKFPRSHPGASWHGFPLGPLEGDFDPPHPPIRALPRDALNKMVESGLLDAIQRSRLLRGKTV